MEGMPLWLMIVMLVAAVGGIFLVIWIVTQAGWLDKFGSIFTGGRSLFA